MQKHIWPKYTALRPKSRFVSILLALAFAVSATAFMSSVAWAFWTGAEERDDLNDTYGISHWSKVEYWKNGTPAEYDIDQVWFGGRKPGGTKFWQISESWRREWTKYYDWAPDPGWSTDTTINAGSWHSTGTPGLDYWYLTNDVSTCCQFARVKQKLRYRFYDTFLITWVEWNGGVNQRDF